MSNSGYMGRAGSRGPVIASYLSLPSKTFQEHLGLHFVQVPHNSQAGHSIESLHFEAFESLYTRTNLHKLDPSSDLEI